MTKEIKVGVKPIRLTGRGSDYARRALGLPANGSNLIVTDNVSLVAPVSDAFARVASMMYGPLARSRKIDVSCLPAGALIDIHHTDEHGNDTYSHTEANPLWWTEWRIMGVWMTVALAERTGAELISSEIAAMLHDIGRVGK